MGGPRTFSQVLLLSAIGIVFVPSLASANGNTTRGPGLLTPENSTSSTPSPVSQESCQGVNLQDPSRS
ncbi:hypothetical protein GOODEAATRI_029995, partial [Goodea atripinnis]